MTFKKNTAVTAFKVGLTDIVDGTDVTTGTPVGYTTLDDGAQTAIGDVTPVHKGNGQWTFDLTAAEMNGDLVGLVFTHTSAMSVHCLIKTETKTLSEINDISTADVNAEVLDVMNVDTHAEPAQGTPGGTVSIFDKINLIYKVLIAKKTATATEISIYNSAGTVVDHKRAISDDSTTYTEDEIVSGP